MSFYKIPTQEEQVDANTDRVEKYMTQIMNFSLGRVISGVKTINMTMCLETFPCGGHEGVEVTFEDGDKSLIKCDSISIAALQLRFNGQIDEHFKGYTEYFDISRL